jgi:hypothetical protein
MAHLSPTPVAASEVGAALGLRQAGAGGGRPGTGRGGKGGGGGGGEGGRGRPVIRSVSENLTSYLDYFFFSGLSPETWE